MRRRLLYLVILFALNTTWSNSLLAHKDKFIRLNGGSLVGLPEEYTPAELNLKASRIRIGDRAMVFSPLLSSLFEQPHNLVISASWYHLSEMPPYILLQIFPKKKDFSYRLLLNLDTLDLIELSVVLESDGRRTWPIALDDRAKADIKNSIQKLK